MIVFVILAIAAVVGAVAIGGVWANRQLLDTGRWVSTGDRMLHNDQIRHRVAEFLTEEVVSAVRGQVGEAGGRLSATQESQLETRIPPLAEAVLASPPVEASWRHANRIAHKALLRILDDKGGRVVVLDLDPVLRDLAREVHYGSLQASPPAPGTGRIVIVRGGELETARKAVSAIRHVPLIATLVLLVLYGLALLGAGPLRYGFAAIGASLVATGLLALFARSIAGDRIVDALVEGPSVHDAADAAWGVATSTVSTLSTLAIVFGAALAAVSLLAGPMLARWAR